MPGPGLSRYEENTDTFHNIENAILAVDRQCQDLGDWQVKEAANALIRAYGFELRGKPVHPPKLKGDELKLYEAMRAVCEWRLGRADDEAVEFVREHATWLPGGRGKDTPELIQGVLRRLEKSISTWSWAEGRRGYLNMLADQFAGNL